MSSMFSKAGSTIGDTVSGVGKGVGNAGASVGRGVGDIGQGVGKGVGEVGKGIGKGIGDAGQGAGDLGKGAGQGATDLGKGTKDISGDVGQGVGDAGKGVTETGGQGTNLLGRGFANGFQIAGNFSKDAWDLQKNVVNGVGSLAGTAIDGVVLAASTTTGAVFDPIANGLKAIEGLEGLGKGVESINGLSTQALQGVASATKEAINVAGKRPTFFDPEGKGVVKFADTQRGFVALGLEEKYAKIAAYALHSTFSYSTSNSWNPKPVFTEDMPIHIENMPKTRWGRNWGNFERVEWVSDTDVETFFGLRERSGWAEYWKDIKSYFGTALLIFEWGTTWPFIFGPALDAGSPMAKQLGTIMRTVILPTMYKSHENAKAQDPNAGAKKEDMPPPPAEAQSKMA